MADVPWTPAHLDEVGDGLRRSGKADAWPETRAAIEAFAARWDAAFVEACELPDEAVRDAAYNCLAPSYARTNAMLDALRVLDPETLVDADETIAGLDSPEACLP
jgi:hypothetical protein